jgi:mRNA interferase RelE/StbE
MKQIKYTKEAIRDLKRIPANTSKRIRSKIETYAADPQSQANNVKTLQGISGVVRLRVGDWRVLMQDGDVLAVLKIKPRGGAY